PFELAASVMKPGLPLSVAVANARRYTAGLVAIDGLETVLDEIPQERNARLQELRVALESAGLTAVVNLNCAVSPSWAEDVASGPLFVPPPCAGEAAGWQNRSEELLEPLLALASPAIRIDWHLGERDFGPGAEQPLLRLATRALEDAPVAFV